MLVLFITELQTSAIVSSQFIQLNSMKRGLSLVLRPTFENIEKSIDVLISGGSGYIGSQTAISINTLVINDCVKVNGGRLYRPFRER